MKDHVRSSEGIGRSQKGARVHTVPTVHNKTNTHTCSPPAKRTPSAHSTFDDGSSLQKKTSLRSARKASDVRKHEVSYRLIKGPAPAPPPAAPPRSGSKKRPDLGFDIDWQTPVRITSPSYPPWYIHAA